MVCIEIWWKKIKISLNIYFGLNVLHLVNIFLHHINLIFSQEDRVSIQIVEIVLIAKNVNWVVLTVKNITWIVVVEINIDDMKNLELKI